MAKPKFPTTIHVTREKLPNDSESYLQVREEGVVDSSIDDTVPCAIYRLVSVGDVEVSRRYVERRSVYLTGKRKARS